MDNSVDGKHSGSHTGGSEFVPCVACKAMIDPRASICGVCQTSQHEVVRQLNRWSPSLSLALAAIAVVTSIVTFKVTSVDDRIRVRFGAKPAVLVAFNWQPELSSFPLDEHGAYLIDASEIKLTVDAFNAGFSAAILESVECSQDGVGYAEVFDENSPDADSLGRVAAEEFHYHGKISFGRDSGGVLGPQQQDKALFSYSFRTIDVSMGDGLREISNQDFAVRIGGEPSCQVRFSYSSELGEEAKTVELTGNSISSNGVFFLSYIFRLEAMQAISGLK